ncbi:MAG: nicotinate-nucleotide adenylyltransferase [Parvibaculales bacterium]
MRRPVFFDGMRVGLFGGSFNPPHEGHVLLARKLQVQLKLDLVWWLVSPQNPLKQEKPENAQQRIKACEEIAGTYKTYISNEETLLGTTYTADTIACLKAKYPNVRFVWIMGADSLRSIHKWRNWQEIFNQVPVAVYPRPNETITAGLGPAAQYFAHARRPANEASLLPTQNTPAWILLDGKTHASSSTSIRQQKTNSQ